VVGKRSQLSVFAAVNASQKYKPVAGQLHTTGSVGVLEAEALLMASELAAIELAATELGTTEFAKEEAALDEAFLLDPPPHAAMKLQANTTPSIFLFIVKYLY